MLDPCPPLLPPLLLVQNKGNTFFAAGKHAEAVASFSVAIELDNTDPVFFSNRCASYTALGKYVDAIADANVCLKLKPDWGKGYSRLGAAQFLAKVLFESWPPRCAAPVVCFAVWGRRRA